MPATDKRNSSVDNKNRSRYPNERGSIERVRPEQRSQKAFTVISQTKSDTKSNVRSRSRSKAIEERNERRRHTDYSQQQEHRSLKDRSRASRDRESKPINTDDRKYREKIPKSTNLPRNAKEERNVTKYSESNNRRADYKDEANRRKSKFDSNLETKNIPNKYASEGKIRQRSLSRNEDTKKLKDDRSEQKHKARTEKTDNYTRKSTMPEIRNEKSKHQDRNEKSKHQDKNYNIEAKSDSVSVNKGTSKSDIAKKTDAVLVDDPKTLNTQSEDDSKAEDDYEDDFEDYESDFESDDNDDSENEDGDNGSKHATDEDSDRDKDNDVREFKFQKPLNRRFSVTSFQEEKHSTVDNYEKQILMNALKKENMYVEEYQHRLRSGHEKPVDIKQIDNAASVADGVGSRRKSLQSGPTSFMNFSSAKSRQATLKELGKTLTRKMELIDSNRITLNEMIFDLFDLPPIDYETYIQSFGKLNAKQAYSQTNEDDLHEEVQTDVIEITDKWTQHPAHDFLGVGGDGIISEDNEALEKILKSNAVRFSKFVKQAGEAMINLLEEDEIMSNRKNSKTTLEDNFSQEYFQLGGLPFNSGGPVIFVNFSDTETHILLTIHGSSDEDENILDNRGLICIWNIHQPSIPQKYLLCSSQPQCGCFNPGKTNLVFAGLLDGSVAAWDLREPSNMHRKITLNQIEIVFRFPAYITAEILHKETHHSPIVCIKSAQIGSGMSSDLSTSEQQLTFYVATLEEFGIIKLWTVMEVLYPNPSGSDTDFGLAPGSRIRLIHSSSINLITLPGLISSSKTDLRTFEIRFLPNDSNRMLITTDMGIIIHTNIQGNKMKPPFYLSGREADLVEACCIDVDPILSLFLVGCSDGSVRLHNTKKDKPIRMWPNATNCPVMQVQWAPQSCTQFYVLDNQSRVQVWDLNKNETSSLVTKEFSNKRALHFHMSSESSAIHHPTVRSLHMAICFDTGNIEIHKICLKSSSNEKEIMNRILFVN